MENSNQNLNTLINEYTGLIDCTTNPNLPEMQAGQYKICSGDGLIGGDNSSEKMWRGDFLVNRISSYGGTWKEAGTNYLIIQKNVNI